MGFAHWRAHSVRMGSPRHPVPPRPRHAVVPRVRFLLPSAHFLPIHWDRKPQCGARTLWGHRETSRAFGSRWAKAQTLVLPYLQCLDVGNLLNHWAWPKLVKLHSQNECLLVHVNSTWNWFYEKKEKSQITPLFCSKPCPISLWLWPLSGLRYPLQLVPSLATIQPHLLSSSVCPKQATTLHLRAFALAIPSAWNALPQMAT